MKLPKELIVYKNMEDSIDMNKKMFTAEDMEKKKSKIELTAFIVMNILGAPIIPILALIYWGWYGLIGSLILFFISFRIWKYIAKSDATLSFNPGIKLGNKTHKLF